MQLNNRLIDDFARVLGGAVSAASGLREEVGAAVRDRLDRWLREADLPRREELEVVEALAATQRQHQEKLEARVAVLEAKLAAMVATNQHGPHANKPETRAPAGAEAAPVAAPLATQRMATTTKPSRDAISRDTSHRRLRDPAMGGSGKTEDSEEV